MYIIFIITLIAILIILGIIAGIICAVIFFPNGSDSSISSVLSSDKSSHRSSGEFSESSESSISYDIDDLDDDNFTIDIIIFEEMGFLDNDETSGICTFIPKKTYFIVQDKTKLVEYNNNFDKLKEYNLEENDEINDGIEGDLEGVTYMMNNLFSVIDENNNMMKIYKLINGDMELQNRLLVNVDDLEGISYDINRDVFYVASKEPDAILYYILNPLNENNIDPKANALFTMENDISGIFYDYVSDTIITCSDEAQILSQYTIDGIILNTFDVSNSGMRKIEGVTLDETRNKLILVGEGAEYATYEVVW